MSDEYLWDRSGEPDEEIARLEAVLGEYRYSARPPLRRRTWAWAAAIAACLCAAAGIGLWMNRSALSDWRIDGKQVAVGRMIETREGGATLDDPAFGEVNLDANSRLQVLASKDGNQRLALRRGVMHALIWAPPARFSVETPSAKSIDLGCAYTLTVLPDDSGLLTVQAGWVAFQNGAVESFIPAGAECHTRPRTGPGLPYFAGASKELRDAIARYDWKADREAALGVTRNARKEDALTLWHLVVRSAGAERSAAVERLAELEPGVDAAGLRAGDSGAIDRAWDLLGLGGADWWRKWKHNW